MNTKLFKIIGIWTLFVVVAILNAAIREYLLAPMIGHKLALPFSGIMLSIFIFLITIRMLSFLKISNSLELWLVGIFWVMLTLAFELLFGHYVIGESWGKLFEVFNILEGNLFLLVLFVTASSPYVAAKIRTLIYEVRQMNRAGRSNQI